MLVAWGFVRIRYSKKKRPGTAKADRAVSFKIRESYSLINRLLMLETPPIFSISSFAMVVVF